MELYLWNVRLSAAFGEMIALAEVILRNAMAEQLATAYGATWYARTELFDDRTMSGFKATWRNITMPADPATGKPAQKTLHAVPARKIVAESTFGCWVNLLDKGGAPAATARTARTSTTTPPCGGRPFTRHSRTAEANGPRCSPPPATSALCGTAPPTTNH
ncbi:hypothetical protein OG586_23420 [Streptomyces murinus]|uniref:hypothetical protein n=1 Tax=Streptomyces murinus TaxID=33900 RepID=UPI002E8168C4|nr:hypothetical protein [Streptomyces murinus]WUD08970.1 hypothetical protein OG586_23420 [Streptomyces murinus]